MSSPGSNLPSVQEERPLQPRAQCFSKTVATVSAAPEENRDQVGFLGAVTSNEEASWSVDIRLKRQIVPFKMDTGGEVTAINEGTYRSLGEPRLSEPTKVLWGPDIECYGPVYGVDEARQAICTMGHLCGERVEDKPSRPAGHHCPTISMLDRCGRH